ncbi:hypothetical protein M3Y98_00476300 [Aphelenchoides besseyi]|nr:hypothetical protein M3Y98_00476300 [Aphelenchoides besseyi]
MSNESQRFVGDKIAAALMLKGIGYNLNDHFVDDTELPSTVPFVETPIRTLYSGFFVNVDDSIKAQENPEIENSHNLSEEKENLQAEKLIIKKLQSQIPDRRAQNEFQISAGPLRPTSNSAIAMARPNVANLATNPIESAPFFQSLHNLQPPPAPAASVNRKRAYCRCQNDCKNNRCGCYKAKVPCSDRCHKAKTCTNVNPIN